MSKSKRKPPKNRQNKIALVFDENKRREFLTGFHKRKVQRKKKAQDDLQQQLKEERKRLKAEAKESYKKLLVSSRPIPEVEELLKEEYEEDNVTVKVVELSANKPVEASESEEEQEQCEEESEVPGMELKPKKKTEEKKVFRSHKDVKKELKRQATKNVQKSKVFQKKNKVERQKQKKKSVQQKKLNERFMTKHKKGGKKQRGSR